jgi:hypothetical protein
MRNLIDNGVKIKIRGYVLNKNERGKKLDRRV